MQQFCPLNNVIDILLNQSVPGDGEQEVTKGSVEDTTCVLVSWNVRKEPLVTKTENNISWLVRNSAVYYIFCEIFVI